MLLEDAVAELESIDPAGLTEVELHELVVAMERTESRFAGVRARLLAVWDSRRGWADDGSKSAAARLARECRLSMVSARRELKRARKLRSMPATAAALQAGRLSVDEADLLAHADQPATAGLFARDEALLVDHVGRLRFPDAVRCVRYWIDQAHDELGLTPASCRFDGRHLSAVRSFAGSVELAGSLDTMGGSEFLSELERLETQLFEADWADCRAEHGGGAPAERLARTSPQRRADALVEMARRSAAKPAAAQPPRPLITVLAGYDAFTRVCELADGTVVAPHHVVPLLGAADIERIVFDGPSRVIDVGVRQRLFTGALRRAIEVRDRHCQHPSGCDVPAEQCHIDHITPYAERGLTIQANGRCYCPVHNRRRTTHPGSQPHDGPALAA